MALANPTGGQVVGGQANISAPGANSTLIKQTSQNAVINWQQFSVGANQYVQFLQPDSSAVVLNRVIGGNPSSIFGNITANGQVFLINPNGILFGRGATLDVSGLVASTQNIGNADFMAGRYNFLKGSGAPDASVINQGAITTTPNGYVVLAGDYVENDGVIQAQSGRVLLAAGGATTLTLDKADGLISYSIDGATLARLAGVRNTGEISADGGTVIMTANVANALTATAVNNTGFIAARSIQSRDGVIILAAVGGDIDNSGTLDASAAQSGVAGGTVIIRGDADMTLDPTSDIDTEGAGAKGGFIELSGHHLHVGGLTRTGAGGSLLLDPAKIHIVAGLASGLGTGNTNSFGTGFLLGKLNASINNNVTLVASQSIAHTGTTALAINAITHAGNLALKIGTLAVGAGGSLSGLGCILHGQCQPGTGIAFTPAPGGIINLKGVTINIKGNFTASASKGSITLDKVIAGNIDAIGKKLILANALKATGALGINLHASAGGIAPYLGTALDGLSASNGSVVVNAGGPIRFDNGISAPNGAIDLNVTAGAVTVSGGMLAKTVKITETGGGGMHVGAITATGKFGGTGSLATDGIALLNTGLGSVVGVSGAKFTAVTGGIKIVGGGFGVGFGSISAAGRLSVSAHNTTALQASIFQFTGKNIKAQSVTLDASASQGAKINVGGITATGGSISINARANASHATKVQAGNLNATARVSVQESGGGSGGFISVGNISAGGSVTVRASDAAGTGGNVAVGAITGRTIQISARAKKGGDINVAGGLSATASRGRVSLSASDASVAANGGNVNVTGDINATLGHVSIVTHGGGSLGGTLHVGNINARGAVSINASYLGAGSSFVAHAGNIKATNGYVAISMTGHSPKFSAGAITAHGASFAKPSFFESGLVPDGFVTVGLNKTGSAAGASGGSIKVNGNVLSSHSGVSFFVKNGNMKLSGPIAATKMVTLTANSISDVGALFISAIDPAIPQASVIINAPSLTAASVKLAALGSHSGNILAGNITATAGNISASAGHGVVLPLNRFTMFGPVSLGDLSATGNIQVSGTTVSVGGVNAGGSMFLYAAGTSANHANITASKAIVFGRYGSLSASGPSGAIHVGNVTTTNGSVSFFASGNHAHPGGVIVTGNVTAKNYVAFFADSKAGSINVGTIKASNSYVSISAGKITTSGPVTAASYVSFYGTKQFNIGGAVTAGAYVTMRGGQITVNGPITAGTQFGVTLPGHSGPVTRGYVELQANSAAGRASINVTGSISGRTDSISAHGGTGANVSVGAITATVKTILVKTIAPRGADIRVNGTLKAAGAFSTGTNVGMGIVLTANATGGASDSGGNIRIQGSGSKAVYASNGGVRLHAHGGLDSGGKIIVNGDILTTGLVDVLGSNVGSCCGSVSLKNVTGQAVHIQATGLGDVITVGGVTANGTKSSALVHDDVQVIAGGSLAPANGITITGPVKSLHGNVTLTALDANMFMQGSGSTRPAITAAGTVTIKGGDIQLGSVSAAGGRLSISAHRVGPPIAATINVAAGDKLSGKSVTIFASDAAYGGHISLSNVSAISGGISIAARGVPSVGSDVISAGSLKASGGGVNMSATHIVSGPITATGFVTLSAFGSRGSDLITVNGAVKGGSGVNMNAAGSVGGDIQVTGAISASHGNIDLQATNFRGASGGNISAGTLHAAGRVQMLTRGGGKAGGSIKVGNITAGSSIFIGARYTGVSSGAFKVQTGTITGEDVRVLMNGRDPKFSAAGISASGPSASRYIGRNLCSGECGTSGGGTHHGFIGVKLTPTGASGALSVTGLINSKHGGVELSVGRGAMVTGAISAAENIFLSGNGITVGAVTGGSRVSIYGNTASAAAHITATGLVKGEQVTVDVNHRLASSTGLAAHGGSINLMGGASATGTLGGGLGSISLTAKTSAAVKMSITSGPLHSRKNLTISERGASGSVIVNGAISASSGNVLITQQGSGGISVGNVHAHGLAELSAFNSHGGTKGITVNGNIDAARVLVFDSASSGSGGNITVHGNVTAHSGSIELSGFASRSGGNLSVTGAIKASNGAVKLFADGAGSAGGRIHVGNVTAGQGASIFASYHGSVASGFIAQTGIITAEFVKVGVSGLAPHFLAAGINATGHSGNSCECGTGYVHVKLTPTGAAKSSGGITITGPVVSSHGTVSFNASRGSIQTLAVSAPRGITMLGGGINVGALTTATGDVRLTGESAAAHATTITVNGSINAAHVFIDDNISSLAPNGGSVNLLGNVVANGNSHSPAAIIIAARKFSPIAPGTMQINTLGLKAVNGSISVAQSAAGGGVKAAGLISGTNVNIHATGSGGISAQSVTANNSITIRGSGSHAGSIHINGGLTALTGVIHLSDSGFAAGITDTGPIAVNAGGVFVNAAGAGGITVNGKVTALFGISFRAVGSHAGRISINGSISGGGEGVDLTAQGVGNNNIVVNGNITVGTNESNAGAALNASAGTHAGGSITVAGKIISNRGAVLLNAHGGGAAGGRINVGSISAHNNASITANYVGASPGFAVKTGKITAENINVSLTGLAPHFSNSGMTANGSAANGNIHVMLNATGAAHSSGVIKITAPVVSTNGSVTLNSGSTPSKVNLGSVSAAAITAKTGIKITGDVIHVGALTAASGSVLLTGVSDANLTTAITVTGAVTAKHVAIRESFLSTAVHGGSISLQGQVTAASGATIEALSSKQPMQINLTGVKASNGSLFIGQDGVGGGIHATGLISAAGGSLHMHAGDGRNNISVASVTARHSAQISASGAGGSAGNITVNGNITGSSVTITDSGVGGANITVNGRVIATSRNAHITANAGSSHSGGNIVITGRVAASSGFVSLSAHGGGAHGGNMDLNNIVAGSGVSINARYNGPSTGFHVKTGVITGGFIQANMDGLDPLFSAAGLAGQGKGCECSADVSVRLSNASFSAALGGSIHINGPVTATAGGVILNAGFGVVNMGGNSISAAGSFGRVRLEGGQLHLGTVKGTGNVSISAFGKSGNAASITTAPGDAITGTRVNINLDNSGSANGANLAIAAVNATGAGTSANSGQINIKDTGFSAQKVTVNTAALTATKAIAVQITDASGSMSLGRLSAPSIKVSLSAGNVTVGNIFAAAAGESINAGGSLTITAPGGLSLTGGTLKAGKAIHVTAGSNLTLNNVSLTDSAFSASAGSNLRISTAGSLNLAGQKAVAGKSLTLIAANTVKVGKAKITGSAVNISAASITNSGSAGTLTAAGGTLKTVNGINLNKEVLHLTGAGMTLSAGSSITLHSAAVTGGGNLTVHAGSGAGATNLSFNGGALQITGSSVNLTGAKVTATKGVIFKGGSVTMTNLHVAGSGVAISASKSGLSNGGSGSLTAGVGGIAIKAKGNVVLGGEAISVTGGGALFSAGGTLNMAGQSISAAKAVILKAGAGNLNLSGVHLKGSGVGITALAGNISNGTGAASITGGAGGIGINAHGNVSLANETITVAGGTAAISAGGSVNLHSAALTGNMNVHAATGVNAANLTFSGGGLQVTAGGNIGLVSATLTAVGSIGLNGANVDLNAATVSATKTVGANATGNVTLRVARLTGAAVNISAGGNVTNSGSATSITAGAGGMSIKAQQNVVLGDEILHVTGGAAKLSAGGSLDLTNASLTAGKGVSLTAGKHLLIGKTAITAGSAFSAAANGSISNGGSAGAITAGSATIKAKTGNIVLTGETLHVGSGKATLSAAGGIAMTGADIIAGSLNGVTAGSIDLTGATAKVSGTLQLIADKDIILSRVNINAGIFLAAASGSIHNGGGPGTITANAINVASKQSINLSSTDITLGSGALPSFAGDTLLLGELAGFGIGPTSSTLNGAFLADGSLTLGGLTITGHYLALQGSSVAILGKVSAPASGLLVQIMPFDPTAAIGVEGQAAATQAFNISNQGLFALFPGDTIAIGDDVESGAVFIGLNGGFTLANKTNLFFDTTGPVTGLDLITSTGLVTTLEVLVATVGTDVVTVGEIDPNAGSTTNTGLGDETDKKHLGGSGGVGGTGQQGGTISNDDTGTGVCH